MTEALREALVSNGPPPGAACSSNDDLWGLLDGDLAPGRAAAVANHSAGCPSCAFALQLGRELRADEIDVRRLPATGHWRWAGAVALAASVLIVLWPRSMREPGSSLPALREADRTAIHALKGEGPVSRAALVLRWTEIAGARYSVQLATEDLTPVWSATGLAQAEARVPAEVLPKASRLVWKVTAQKQDGSTATSKTFLLELR